jgi:predicted DNA-binding protein (MmcQ/YjbR family)
VSVRAWDTVRDFALSLPCATEDFPWGETVVKIEKRSVDPPPWRRHLVHGPMFLWLGRRDAQEHALAVKLTDSYEQAVALARAVPTTHSGLGQWGWLTVALSAADVALLCDWVDESYRNTAPKALIAELDARMADRPDEGCGSAAPVPPSVRAPRGGRRRSTGSR